MEKLFYEKRTGKYAKTLSAAKGMALQKRESPYIYRVWRNNGEVVGKSLIYAYGEQICTIMAADRHIAKLISDDEDRQGSKTMA